MNTSFRIVPVTRKTFAPFFALTDAELADKGMRRLTADKKPYYPCRVSLVDAEPGESVLMLSFTHYSANTPYRSRGPIFVRENATEATPGVGELPEMLRSRLMSVRAYDDSDKMVSAEVAEGTALEAQIEQSFADPLARYLHLHNAKVGCFFCRINRA